MLFKLFKPLVEKWVRRIQRGNKIKWKNNDEKTRQVSGQRETGVEKVASRFQREFSYNNMFFHALDFHSLFH